ncbi:MAG: hypothetical protein MZV63_35960 [Marinilabiliales bacterium]|nr:hypothetical protein [Marinilabiliales bacterium]
MADKINAADSMIFQTEKQLKEFGDKIPADKKGRIETCPQLSCAKLTRTRMWRQLTAHWQR